MTPFIKFATVTTTASHTGHAIGHFVTIFNYKMKPHLKANVKFLEFVKKLVVAKVTKVLIGEITKSFISYVHILK